MTSSFTLCALAVGLTVTLALPAQAQRGNWSGNGIRPVARDVMPETSYSAQTNFVLRCSGCHGTAGLGTPDGEVPAFPDSVGHIANSDIGRTYMMHVPGVISASLSNAEIAEVMNFILAQYSDGSAAPYTEAEVNARRAIPIEDVVAYRRVVAQELAADGITIADYPWP
ncbi:MULTISPECIES: hypothetical protein [unclassified Yoonia]|uniref:c-type cytochrome n=1 Tax=unclassified Yoonia TaxID=2629118 RepID=UPI002AFE727F|nr:MULTISPECIES: hypothetical protein [unclassified Yoonia]